jgi:DNA-binding CsgD family transcriptional regulator
VPTYAKAPIRGIPAARAAEYGLTPREFTVLILLAEALTAAAIGRRLGISARTVHRHLEHLYRKLNTSDRLGAVLRAQDLGLLPPRADTGHSGDRLR